MNRDVELQKLVKVTVVTIDGNENQVTVPVVGDEQISVTDIYAKACDCLGLQKTSSKWFSLFCGGETIRRLKPDTFTHSSAKEVSLRKWCFNGRIEANMIKDDPVACHLVYLEAKAAIEKGLLSVTNEQREKLEEYEDPAFKLEKDYILLAQSLEGYFSVLIQNCKITDQEPIESTLQSSYPGSVRVSMEGIILHTEKCSRTLKWTRLKKWTVHNKLSRVAFLHVSPSGEEQTVVVETHQCEYLLSAIIQIVKELQVMNPSESFFYSSMISTNEEGSTSYENVLYSGPCDGVDDEGR